MRYLVVSDYEIEANPHIKKLMFEARTADEIATGITSFTYAIPESHHNMSLILLSVDDPRWLDRDLGDDKDTILKLVF